MNLKLAVTVAGAALLIAPALALASSPQSASMSTLKTGTAMRATVNWEIPLKPGPLQGSMRGKAQYQSQPGQREFQIELTRLTSLSGSSLLVQANHVNVGWMKVSKAGIAQLSRNSELGQRAPAIAHGSLVTVKTKTGALIASGIF